MRDAARDDHALAGRDDVLLLPDDKPKAPLEHVRDLFVRMGMAGHDCAGTQVDPGDGHRLGMNELSPNRGIQLLDRLLEPSVDGHAAILDSTRRGALKISLFAGFRLSSRVTLPRIGVTIGEFGGRVMVLARCADIGCARSSSWPAL
jgi:hypothetical protein